jgi:hypothetical protein
MQVTRSMARFSSPLKNRKLVFFFLSFLPWMIPIKEKMRSPYKSAGEKDLGEKNGCQ